MKINYHPNPFKTTIDVDNNDITDNEYDEVAF